MTAALSVAGAPAASRRDVTIALTIGVVALLIAGLQPVILGGLESEGRLTASQIGLAATVELLALGLTCGLAAAFLKPDRVRLKLALACVAHAGAMFGTCLVTGVAVIAMRGAAGVFAGLMLWAAISTITLTLAPGSWHCAAWSYGTPDTLVSVWVAQTRLTTADIKALLAAEWLLAPALLGDCKQELAAVGAAWVKKRRYPAHR